MEKKNIKHRLPKGTQLLVQCQAVDYSDDIFEIAETKSAKIIYADKNAEDYTPKNGKTFELDELQGIVDGYIEIIRLNDGRVIIVDEEGKNLNREVNIPATNILSRDRYTTDYIVGTAIVCDADMVE